MNAYRESPDAARLNEAKKDEALVVGNGHYISMADVF